MGDRPASGGTRLHGGISVAGGLFMAITIDAVYENGVVKPQAPLSLREQQMVRITLQEPIDWVDRTRGIIPCSDHALVEWAAMDPDLEYDRGRGQ
jgi:predicted DNA-binding antitoxin AbrB/MazE fold protein